MASIVREERIRSCRCNWRGGRPARTSCGHGQVTIVSWVAQPDSGPSHRFTTRRDAQSFLNDQEAS